MSVDRTFRCDGPECESFVMTTKDDAPDFITAVERFDAPSTFHFCTWDCVLRFAAQVEPSETIPLRDEADA